MLVPRSENARLQSNFYRDQYRRVLRLLLASLVLVFILLTVIIYLIIFREPQQYYANTTEGRILPMPGNMSGNRNGT